MSNLLFEIGCEELPASACREAQEQLSELLRGAIGGDAAIRVFVGPRRLAALVEGLPERTADEWVKGPPEHLRERAAASFAARHGVSVDSLEVRDGFLGVVVPGARLADVLPERLAEVVDRLAFSKTMRWNGGTLRFSRPVRWLCAKLDAATVEVPLEGVPSGGTSQGHRFVAGEVEIAAAIEYLDALRSAQVEPDQDARRAAIVRGLDAAGEWRDPSGVLEEVIHLVEWPVVLTGSYDERFLELPAVVIETVMQSHQRYFPLGAGAFAFVANGGDPETVVAGNEAVLAGRLDDASFSYVRDVEKGIETMAEELTSITFHARAGTFADKAERLAALCEDLGGGEASRAAARLAKADQASTMVHELPELEGVMGGVYARLAGVPEAVAAAIEEQYLPDSAGGRLPESPAGRVLAAAEKVDNLTVAFALGERPTGSRDPYGLRRAAIGLCRLAVEAGLEIELGRLVEHGRRLLLDQGAEVTDDPADVRDFVLERLEGILEVPVECVRAARAGAVRDLGGIAALAETLAAERESESFARAYAAFDRAARLAGRSGEAAEAFDPKLTTDEAEIALAETLTAAGPRIQAALDGRDFDAALAAAGELGPPVDRFFDEVLVMAEDGAVRANRLRLLLDVRDAVGALGDLGRIPR